MSNTPQPVSQLRIEQYLLGELPAEEHQRIEAWAQTEEGADQIAALKSATHKMMANHPPAVAAADIRRKIRVQQAEQASKTRRRAVFATLAVGLAAVLLIVWLQGPGADTRSHQTDTDGADTGESTTAQENTQEGIDDPTEVPAEALPDGALAEVTREKGLAPRLTIHRDGPRGPEELLMGAKAQARDLLQISYVPAGRVYGVIVSIDGRGQTTLHFPINESASTRLDGNKRTPLASAYELDDAPRFERFFFVTSDKPIAVHNVLSAARTLAAGPHAMDSTLTLPKDLEQTAFIVHKLPLDTP